MKSLGVLPLALMALFCCVLMLEFSDGAVAEKRKENDIDKNHIETIAETEKRLKKLINSGFKVALPYLMTMVTETQLNRNCLHGLMMLVKGVMDIKDWAIKMVDALGKPSAGILEGTAIAMGDYDECLEIVVPRRMRPPPVPPYAESEIAFYGQYCVVQVLLPDVIKQAAMAYQVGNRSNSDLANTKTFLKNFIKIGPRADVAEFRLGICIPSVCSKNDLQSVVDEITKVVMLNATAIRCESQTKRRFETEQIAILSAFGILGILIFIGTSVEVVHGFTSQEPIDDVYLQKRSFWLQSAVAFSIPRNSRKLFSLHSTESSKITSIRGLKFASICLYILVWTYATPQDFHFLKYRSAFYFLKFMEEWWFTMFANASAGIDTLFLIAGLQLSYQLWWKSVDQKIAINVPKFLLKWYFRFTLSQIVVISLLLCLPLMGNGPLWDDVVSPIINNCKERWWLNMFALNNFWSSDLSCLPHTWLICSLFHMALAAPILLFILSKSTTMGIFVNCIIIVGSSAAIAMVTLMNELPPAPAFYFLSFVNVKEIWQKLFIQAYDHVAPFCLGILLGVFLHRFDKVKMSKITVTIGWFCTIICNMSVMCGLYGYRHGEPMGLTLSAIYAALHRTVWAMGICWIIFACAYGYGGFVNSILSCKFLTPCNRIAALTYLLHPLILFLHEGQLRERKYMAHFDTAMYATAYIVFTMVLAAACYVMCAAPFIFFEKKMWHEQSKLVTNDAENPTNKIRDYFRESIEVCKKKRKLQFFRQSITITPK